LKKTFKYNLDTPLRLDKYLKGKLPNLSRTYIQKMIDNNLILIDDFSVKSSFQLKLNQIIQIDTKDFKGNKISLKPQKMKLNVIYEDNHILILNKDSGTVVHPGIGNKDFTLLNGVLDYCENLSTMNNDRPGVIHRLDKDTSGVIVFAKNNESHYFISEQFANREIKKEYKSITWGNLSERKEIRGFLRRDPKNRLKFRLFNNKGKNSISIVKPGTLYSIPISFVTIFPLTGRTHQIRVHLSSIGHPIIKDDLYNGSDSIIRGFHEKDRKSISNVLAKINRFALHARRIELKHPKTKKSMIFEAPYPNDFINTLNKLNEYK
tara:strand:- start:5476 stop:6438 length:963 start_codon:yes stop_codon:yes gene_type:complete